MLIVSEDKLFSAAIKQYLEDSKITQSVLDRCVIIDLDSSLENPRENAVTFSRYENKLPDLLRPFLMTELADIVKKRFSDEEGSSKDFATATGEDMFLTSDGVTYKDDFIPLTPKEHKVLELLVSRRGCAISRDEIYRQLWKDDGAESNVVDVYIRYLRKKLDFHFGERIIYTRRGCGYYIK